MSGDKDDHEFKIYPGSEVIVQLNKNAVPPLGGGGRLIASNTLIFSGDEPPVFLSADAETEPNFVESVFNNATIFFQLVPGINGASVVSNEDNWGLSEDGIGANKFHQRGVFGQGVRIGIADSGMDSQHPIFSDMVAENRLISYAHFDKRGNKQLQRRPNGSVIPDEEAVPTFGHWHGTHCAGTLVGGPVDGKRHGVAPAAELSVVRVLEHANEGSVAGILAGLSWLTTQDCDVVSVSLGWPGLHEEWWEPIEALLAKGVIVVAAVGNEGLSPGPQSRSPANYLAEKSSSDLGRLIPVGAHNQAGDVWDESSGELVDWSNVTIPQSTGSSRPSVFSSVPPRIVPTLVGPGVNIISGSAPDGKYRATAGSSMATPHLAGFIALILSELRSNNANTKPNEAADLLLECLQDIGALGLDVQSGYGRVDQVKLSQKIAEKISTQ